MKKLSNLYTIFTLVILISLDFECKDTKIRLFPHTAMDFCHLFLKNALFLIYVKHIYPFED